MENKTTVSRTKTAKVKTKTGKEYSYKYVDIAQIHEYLEKNKLSYYQYVDRVGNDDYIMTVKIKEGKESEPLRGCRIVDATLFGTDNPAQKQGSALTYARRYSLLMAFGLATEDDDGKQLELKMTKEEEELIFIYMGRMKDLEVETNTAHEEILKYFRVESDMNMSLKQLKQAVSILETKKQKNKKEVF